MHRWNDELLDLYIKTNSATTGLENRTRHSYIYMFPIAGQTAGPIGLTFFGDTHGWPGVL